MQIHHKQSQFSVVFVMAQKIKFKCGDLLSIIKGSTKLWNEKNGDEGRVFIIIITWLDGYTYYFPTSTLNHEKHTFFYKTKAGRHASYLNSLSIRRRQQESLAAPIHLERMSLVGRHLIRIRKHLNRHCSDDRRVPGHWVAHRPAARLERQPFEAVVPGLGRRGDVLRHHEHVSLVHPVVHQGLTTMIHYLNLGIAPCHVHNCVPVHWPIWAQHCVLSIQNLRFIKCKRINNSISLFHFSCPTCRYGIYHSLIIFHPPPCWDIDI